MGACLSKCKRNKNKGYSVNKRRQWVSPSPGRLWLCRSSPEPYACKHFQGPEPISHFSNPRQQAAEIGSEAGIAERYRRGISGRLLQAGISALAFTYREGDKWLTTKMPFQFVPEMSWAPQQALPTSASLWCGPCFRRVVLKNPRLLIGRGPAHLADQNPYDQSVPV